MHGSWMFGGGYAMVLVWAVLIALLIALVVYLTKPPGRSAAGKTGLDMLKEQYARGEIGKKEVDEKKRDIAS